MINFCTSFVFVGAVYQDKCETQPNIPVFLIVGGGAASITFIIGGIFLLAYDSTDFRGKFVKILFGGLTLILLLFCFAWYITGCVWIYKLFRTMKKANYIKYLKKWGYPPCHKVLYWFAFAMLQASYLVIGPLFKLCK